MAVSSSFAALVGQSQHLLRSFDLLYGADSAKSLSDLARQSSWSGALHGLQTRPPQDSTMQEIPFELRGAFIPLDALLKATGVAGSGGAAKAIVAAGQVLVDGQTELPKTCKIRPGQVVTLARVRITVAAARA